MSGCGSRSLVILSVIALVVMIGLVIGGIRQDSARARTDKAEEVATRGTGGTSSAEDVPAAAPARTAAVSASAPTPHVNVLWCYGTYRDRDSEPALGHKHIWVGVTVQNYQGATRSVRPESFRLEGGLVTYEPHETLPHRDALRACNVMQGCEVQGYLCFEILEQDEHELLLVMDASNASHVAYRLTTRSGDTFDYTMPGKAEQ